MRTAKLAVLSLCLLAVAALKFQSSDIQLLDQAKALLAQVTSTDVAVQDSIGHAVTHIDTAKALLLNPTVVQFSTYLGSGAMDSPRDVAVDGSGNVYVVGGTASTGFSVTQGQPFNSGACSTLGTGGRFDAFVVKYSPAGAVLWSQLLGGPCYDRAYAVEVDASGAVYVAGRAGAGFPTTAGALQEAFGGDTTPVALYGSQDGFVVKLDAAGAVQWASYVGGPDQGIIRDVAVDAAGNPFVVMQHVTQTHPHVTAGAFQTTRPGGEDVVVLKLSAAGQLVWGTYYGGSGYDGLGASIRVNSANQAVVLMATGSGNLPTVNAYQSALAGGQDFALAQFTADGSALVFSTYLGGAADEGVETHHLAIGAADDVYLAGITRSANFPTTTGAYQRTAGGGVDVGLARFSSTGQLLAASYFGTPATDGVQGVAVNGGLVFTGSTTSQIHVTTPGALQSALKGTVDAYLVKFSADLSQVTYLSYLGGSAVEAGRGIAVSGSVVVVTGETSSTDWLLVNAADGTYGGGTDAFVASVTLSGS